MNPVRTLPVLAVVAFALPALGMRALATRDPGERAVQVFPEMRESVAAESFAAHPELPGGIVQQLLPEGVQPLDVELFPYGAGLEEAERAGRELRDPLPPGDPAVREAGAALYRIYCQLCHGAGGAGDGPVVRRGMLPPPSLLADRARQLPDGTLFHILSRGQNGMASYAAQLRPEERWQVIRFLRSLQGRETQAKKEEGE